MITIWLLFVIFSGEPLGARFDTLEDCEKGRAAVVKNVEVTDLSQCIKIDVVKK